MKKETISNIEINIIQEETAWKGAFSKMKYKITKVAEEAYKSGKKPIILNKNSISINIVLMNDQQIKKLNKGFRGKNKSTNVLSFPQFILPIPGHRNKKSAPNLAKLFKSLPTPICLGDIMLAWETINNETIKQKKSLENHTLHLIVHGILHLLGYDHMSLKDASCMENKERDILAYLGYPDPYASSNKGC